jgi:hypothetical protein
MTCCRCARHRISSVDDVYARLRRDAHERLQHRELRSARIDVATDLHRFLVPGQFALVLFRPCGESTRRIFRSNEVRKAHANVGVSHVARQLDALAEVCETSTVFRLGGLAQALICAVVRSRLGDVFFRTRR